MHAEATKFDGDVKSGSFAAQVQTIVDTPKPKKS